MVKWEGAKTLRVGEYSNMICSVFQFVCPVTGLVCFIPFIRKRNIPFIFVLFCFCFLTAVTPPPADTVILTMRVKGKCTNSDK